MSKYVVYPAYKDSGVKWLGKIPEHWTTKKFKYLFEIRKRIAGELGFNILSITQKGIKVKDIESGAGQLSADYSKYQHVYKGDYAMNHMDLLTGFVDLSKYDGVTSPDYRVFSLIEKDSNAEYYLYLLQMGYINKIFYPLGQGSSQFGRWRLPSDAFKEFQAPFLPQHEQQTIANYLNKATAKIDILIAKQTRLIELLKEKRQAVISTAVTRGLDSTVTMKDSGVEWLEEIPEGWEVSKLGYITTKIGSGKTPRGGAEVYSDSGVLFLRSQNIYDEGLFLDDVVRISEEINNDMENTQVKSGDILLNVTGGSIGRTTIVPIKFERANVNQHVCIIRLSSEKQQAFIALVMKSLTIKTQIDAIQNGAAREGLNFEQISGFKIALPPIKEQDNIVTYIDDKTLKIDTLITKATKAIDLLKEKRTALISSVVTGKIDVRGEN